MIGIAPVRWLTRAVSKFNHNSATAGSLLVAVFLWGGNNAGTKWLVATWPPIWSGCIRFLLAGLILLGILRYTNRLGQFHPLTPTLRKAMWRSGGLGLAAYVIAFYWALKLTAASHVALYIGASPIWALLAEERPRWNQASLRRYAAALLAVTGVLVLFWPALHTGHSSLTGEFLGLLSGVLWANYSWQARRLSQHVTGVEVAAYSMWMGGIWLLPVALIEIAAQGLVLDAPHLGVQLFCIVFGGVVPYALWNTALRHWRTSQVMLFNSLIPLSTTAWVHFTLGETITPTFCAAMILIVVGVLMGQVDWAKVFKLPEGF